MRICYVLLSPTFGMHQYTADPANQMVQAGHDVALVTTSLFPRDRYAPEVEIRTPITTSNTGLSKESLDFRQLPAIIDTVVNLKPDVVHFTGPHLWNVSLVRRLRRLGYPVIHTIHDLDPHAGLRFGSLLQIWNRLIIREADRILVHGRIYQRRLLKQGLAPQKVIYTPLLHLFVSYTQALALNNKPLTGSQLTYEPFMLFFGRLEKYKGITQLLTAFSQIDGQGSKAYELVLAGPGNLASLWQGELPTNVKVRNRLIEDDEAIDLFQRCSLLVLPYISATQSALVAAAYFFSKPVLVSRSGALTEYVEEGKTGFTVQLERHSAFVRQMSDALRDREQLQRMGRAGRIWYEQRRSEELNSLKTMYADLS